MTRSGVALIKLKSIVATLYLSAYSASDETRGKKSADEENRNKRDSDEGRGGTAGRREGRGRGGDAEEISFLRLIRQELTARGNAARESQRV
jgi:hypothetical protein